MLLKLVVCKIEVMCIYNCMELIITVIYLLINLSSVKIVYYYKTLHKQLNLRAYNPVSSNNRCNTFNTQSFPPYNKN